MQSLVVKRSIAVHGHKTSVTLEEAFWNGLKQIASDRQVTMSDLVSEIDSGRLNANLSSAIRLFVLDHYRTMLDAAAGKQNPDTRMVERGPPALDNQG